MLLDGKSSSNLIHSPTSAYHSHSHQHHPQQQSYQQPSGLPISSTSSSSDPSSSDHSTSSSSKPTGGGYGSTPTTTKNPFPSSSDQKMNLNAHASSSKLPNPSSIPSISQLRPIPPFQGGKSSQIQGQGQLQNGIHPSNNPNQNGSTNLNSTSSNHLSMPTTAADLMREGPRDFTVIKEVGDGSFGTVCLADWKSPLPSGTVLSPMQHPTTRPEYVGKRLVAIKKMKKPFPSWGECMKLKELKVS